MGEATPGSKESATRRVLLSVGLAALPLLGERLPLPGVDVGGRLFATNTMPWLKSVMALGMAPILSAFMTVEYGYWYQTLGLSSGEQVMWQREERFDDVTGKSVLDAYRSYIVTTPAIVTGDDVRELTPLSPADDSATATVGIKLSTEAGERFRLATRANVHGRLAIVVGDEVASAPIVTSEIRGGTLQITLGRYDDPDAAFAAAKRMVARLQGH